MPTSKGTQARHKRRLKYLAQKNKIFAAVETDSTIVTTVTGSSQASRSQSEINAVARAKYAANSELKKAQSKMRYAANAEQIKAGKRIQYAANPEPMKAVKRSKYAANSEQVKAVRRSKYAANSEQVKAVKRSKYAANSEQVKAVKRSKYAANSEQVKAAMKRRYALTEPNSLAKHQHIATLKSKLIGNAKLRTTLKKAFQRQHKGIGEKMSRTALVTLACRLAANRMYTKALDQRKKSVKQLLHSIRLINAMDITPGNFGNQSHSASSEPYFYDTAYTPVGRDVAIPVDMYGRCISAEELGSRDENTKRPRKWRCTEECKLPNDEDIANICSAKKLCQMPMEELRRGLDELDQHCPNDHHMQPLLTDACFDDSKENEFSQQLMGHPLPCAQGMCGSLLRTIRSAAVHYPRIRSFLSLFYRAGKHHRCISDVDAALSSNDFEQLMTTTGVQMYAEIFKDDDTECDDGNISNPGLVNLEAQLQVKYAEVMTTFEKQTNDDPEYACCSCERLHQYKNVTSLKQSDKKFSSDMWQQVKEYTVKQNPKSCIETLWVCQHCRVKLNANQMPSRCVLNGLETEPIPPELSDLDSLSKQLIQRAKAFQTIVHLGTYTAKVPQYNSLKACKGTMFFLPLPLEKTLETLGDIKQSAESGCLASPDSVNKSTLPHPELFIMVNGKPSNQKVVWRSIVDVNALKDAIHKLKEINWLYKGVDENDIDNVTHEVIETVSETSSTMLQKASKEEVASLQSFTIRTLNAKHSTTSDIEQYKLLNVKENALDNRQKYLDVMCFPSLFPSGKFGEHHPRKVKISYSEYAKSRLLNKDSRFRKDPAYVFYLLWQKEMRELASGVYNLLKSTKQQRMPVGVFLDKVSASDSDVEANLSTMFQQIRGTKQYWFLKSSDLKCMLQEWGSPTLFLTFSCAEYDSPDISTYLRKVNNVSESYPIGRLCCEDPISVSRKFSQKFHAFFNTVILKGRVLGTVSHFFFKKEYQARGAPHYHVVLWIDSAPVIGKDKPEEVLKWVQERISCRIPDEGTNPELFRLVTKYQMHKCSSYCKRTKKYGGAFITKCKFGFPREMTDIASLNCVEDCLKSRTKIYCLPRAASEVRVNDYNPLLLLLWKANMDIQFIAESSLALAHYVTGYVTKAERSNMQELWQEVGATKSIYSRLWSFGIRSLRSRECGLYEACDLILGDHLCEKSVVTKWIDATWPHKRKRRLIDHGKLQELKQSDPDSTEIFEANLIDHFYPQRCQELENVCLYDMVRDYDKNGIDSKGQYTYSKLTKPRLPKHKLYDPSKENEREDYYYSLLLLFVPFRSEADLIEPNERAEEAFQRYLQPGSNLNLHHEKLQQMLLAQSKVREINEARKEDNPPPTAQDNDETGLQVVGEAQSAMNDVRDLQGTCAQQVNLEKHVSMLNEDQARIFEKVKEHLLHQQRHETNACQCSQFKPLHMFLSGVGGTGKSFLIEAIRQQVAAIWKDTTDGVTCAVAAPTGLAAFNVGGVTVHRLLQLPIEHEGKTAGYWSLPKESQKIMRAILRDVKLLIVDEVSMLSNLNLAYMHLRLEEVFGGEEWFGSLNVIFVGDLLQLPPVNGAAVFEKMVNKAILSKLGCMMSVNIWQETIVYDELTINERQKTDLEYCAVLDEVRRGCPSNNTIALLNDRLIQGDVVEHFWSLQQSGQSPVFLFPTRKSCEQFNDEMLSRLESKVVEVPCSDEIDETSGTQKWSKRAASELERLNKDCNLTAGLEAVLRIAVGARVMLRRNIDTRCGLVNGAIGTVIAIGTISITVKFDHMPDAMKLEKVRSRFLVMKNFYVYRRQFPLILAYAVTIHKCQGLSLDCAVIDLSDQVFSPGMAYVALSRVRTLAGVHLIAFSPKSIMVSGACLQEINRLRQRYRKDLPAYPVPCSTGSSRKRQLNGKLLVEVKPKKRKVPTAKNRKPAKKQNCFADKHSDSTQILSTTNGGQMEWSMFRYHNVDATWQRKMCGLLGLQYCCANRFGGGGPDRILTLPSGTRDSQRDGNCLFRSFAMIITGSEAEHFALRTAIVNHMQTISHLLLGPHITSHASLEAYIHSTAIDKDGAWGTDVEIFTASHLLQTNVYTFHRATSRWLLFSPTMVDKQLTVDIGQRSMYIIHENDHYQVVSSVLRPCNANNKGIHCT